MYQCDNFDTYKEQRIQIQKSSRKRPISTVDAKLAKSPNEAAFASENADLGEGHSCFRAVTDRARLT